MSEKKELRWENPAQIYVPGFLNNRELNPVYVEALEDSMQKDGFLPTFPIVCFRRIDLEFFDEHTTELYICAAGAHRTTAAQNLGLEKVYIDLRTGTMDDFIEAMHTDNFQFDPALDTSLGQLFTKTEKREACKQLLLIPKYLKLTNVALAEMWHTSEGNIRRWREEVASSINEDSDRVIFGHLPEGRLTEIQDILDSKIRENSDGTQVQVRSKPKTDKWDYYWGIQEKVKTMQDLEWDPDIRSYCLSIHEQEPGDLSMQKLSELDRLISARDKDFLEQVRFYGEKQRQLKAAQETCHKAFRECEDAFVTYMNGMGENISAGYRSDEYKACLKSFGRAVSRNFGKHLLGSRLYTDTVAKYERETTQLNTLTSDIEKNAEYVEKFAQRYLNRRLKKRKALETELVTAQHEMLAAAKKKYPDLDLTKFTLAVDADSYWLEIGTTPAFPMEASHIPEGQKDSQLEYIRDHYIEMHSQVEEGEAWIERLMIVQSDPDKEGLSKEFKRIFTLHTRFARDLVDCRTLSETYHLPEEDVREMMGDFQGELSALEIAVRKQTKAAPDISAEDIADRVEVDDIEVVKAMIAKIQLDEANRPAIPEVRPEKTEEHRECPHRMSVSPGGDRHLGAHASDDCDRDTPLPPLEPLSAWGAWRAQNFSGYFKLKQYLLDNYDVYEGYKLEYQRTKASISQNCHVSAVEACLREIEFEKSCERKACNWSRVLGAFDVMRAELDKIEWTGAEQSKIEKLSAEIVSTMRPYKLTRETHLAILGKVLWNLMEQLDDKSEVTRSRSS